MVRAWPRARNTSARAAPHISLETSRVLLVSLRPISQRSVRPRRTATGACGWKQRSARERQRRENASDHQLEWLHVSRHFRLSQLADSQLLATQEPHQRWTMTRLASISLAASAQRECSSCVARRGCGATGGSQPCIALAPPSMLERVESTAAAAVRSTPRRRSGDQSSRLRPGTTECSRFLTGPWCRANYSERGDPD
jgi:hypothetical protein